ncbi:MAG: hypothetical protein JSW11_06710 [Candidatus Heimdallarchaeota archaeon]|nr:MAG: hypothetical protein JSW11_06710 [Candidatus Heimdallarchaeota archaeon]
MQDTTKEHLRYYPIYYEEGETWIFNETYELYGHNNSDPDAGYIMIGSTPHNWYLHPDTENRVTTYIDIYDGF